VLEAGANGKRSIAWCGSELEDIEPAIGFENKIGEVSTPTRTLRWDLILFVNIGLKS